MSATHLINMSIDILKSVPYCPFSERRQYDND
jgi:hypothetical protein